MNVDAMINKVLEGMSTKTVIGETIEIDGIKMIPIVNVAFGFGAGSGDDGKSGNQSASGMGGGGGARMKVAGMLVIKDGDVKFIQTGKGGAIDKLIDSMPDLIDKVKAKVEKSADEAESSS